MKYLTFVLIIFTVSLAGTKKNKALEMLSNAKYTGACGIYNAQYDFQKTTGIGETAFKIFWAAEIARLGMTMDQWAESCANVLIKYKFYTDIVNKNM